MRDATSARSYYGTAARRAGTGSRPLRRRAGFPGPYADLAPDLVVEVVAGFVTDLVDEGIDLAPETSRLLQNQLRSASKLQVIEPDRPP